MGTTSKPTQFYFHFERHNKTKKTGTAHEQYLNVRKYDFTTNDATAVL